ncbi:protein SOB FIVE-LIKE 5-like [Cornus florida]|uniref:protein SOB FIVE-LIKE 5-like n=1 Tax=Cornus florida TaxID=4283 RepID=UPI00289846ED|nr:protein SOB FIVE-LIKE 5-like [Cornus florida]
MNGVLGHSECNSGCESGWTLYLEHSCIHPYTSHSRGNEFVNERGVYTREEKRYKGEDEDEEEDLSMVSDASSGPPHFHEEEDYRGVEGDNIGKRQKNIGKRQKIKEHPSFLDDTASSPIFNLSSNNFTVTNNQASMDSILDFSQGYSATHFEDRSAFHGHFGFFQPSQKSIVTKPVI